MFPLMMVAIGLYSVNSILLVVLAVVFARTAISTKAAYPLGLFIFSVLLLAQSAGTAMGYFLMSGYFGDGAIPMLSLLGSLELVGLLALLKITL